MSEKGSGKTEGGRWGHFEVGLDGIVEREEMCAELRKYG